MKVQSELDGDRIRVARLVRSLTQIELARLTGVSGPVVSKWEKGHIRPSPQQCEKIKEHLGLEIEPRSWDYNAKTATIRRRRNGYTND